MSDLDDGIDFEGGFFEEAGINANDIPEDAYGFGNRHWPLVVVKVDKPKVTGNQDKIGMKVYFAVDHPKYAGHQVSKQLGWGNWIQLPVPKVLQNQIPWDPENNPKDAATMVNLRKLFEALGFKADELGKVNGPKMIGRRCMARIKVSQNDQGFDQFNLNNFKTVGEGTDEGWSEYKQGSSSNGGAKSAEELLKEELENS
jgi:hypothetical protein